MRVEITGYSFKELENGLKSVIIYATDLGEIRQLEIERQRVDDYETREIEFIFESEGENQYLIHWLNRQKVVIKAREESPKQVIDPRYKGTKLYGRTRGCIGWEDALSAVVGTIVNMNSKYINWNPA